MTILITKSEKMTNGGFFLTATADKVSAWVSISSLGYYQTCCMNDSHRAYRSGGKFNASLSAALAGYKSPQMKAIIQLAADSSAKAYAG